LSSVPDGDVSAGRLPTSPPERNLASGSPQVENQTEDLVDKTLALLTLRDRVALLTGSEYWRTRPMDWIGLRQLVFSDGATGVRGERWSADDPSVCFPSPAALGATWDAALVGRLAGEVAAEARRKGVDVVLAPTVNLQRSPLAGRHFEYLAEDPLLAGRLASAYVTGLQQQGVAAAAKHYVANDAETHRFTVDVRIDEQTLREVYLAPFEELVTSAGVWVVMAAYNSVDGVTMTENSLLKSPLVEEWGFDGVVVSDWYAARSTEASARGGLTLVMPGPDGPWGPALLAAIVAGRVAEASINDKVRRLVRLASRVGALTPPDRSDLGVAEQSTSARTEREGLVNLMREAVAASVVLASNAAVLPLEPGSVRSLAVLGPNAADVAMQGGGSSEVVPQHSVTVIEALQKAFGTRVRIDHAIGAPIREGLWPVGDAMATCTACGRPGVHVRYLNADGDEVGSEHHKDGRLIWSGRQLPQHATVEVTARLRADVAGWWRVGAAGVGHVRLDVDGRTVLEELVRPPKAGFASSFIDPPQRWVDLNLDRGEQLDVVLVHLPEYEIDFVKAVLGVRRPQAGPEEELARAVELAKAADVALVVVGTNEEIETEGRDRTTLSLPGRQDELVSRIAEVNLKTVVVVISGAPVAMPWRNQVSAVVWAPFGGQELGPALADVLLGLREPGGRLATTWAADEADLPANVAQPGAAVTRYEENLNIGYRAWFESGRQPVYWFGHGLGYTSWSYEQLDAPTGVVAGEDVTVGVTLANVGRRRGREVVQVYLSRLESSVRRPPVWLAGFAVVTAKPGEVRQVDVCIAARSFQHWSVDDHGWRTESGDFSVSVGRSVGDRPLTAEVTVVLSEHDRH